MTTIDLSPIDRRLVWADAHAQRVSELSAEWGATAMRTTTTTDAERGIREFRAEVIGEPPVTIALALSDVLHHARAALDNSVGVLRGGATDQSAFRIDTDPALFDRDDAGRLAGLPEWAMAAVRQVQPFPDNPWRHVGEQLLKLHRLAILDRHRALLLSAAMIDLHKTHAATSHPGKPSSTSVKAAESDPGMSLGRPGDPSHRRPGDRPRGTIALAGHRMASVPLGG